MHALWIIHSFFPFQLSHTHTHTLFQHFLLSLQTAFPEDTEEAVVVFPTLPPSLSFSVSPLLSAHGNHTVGSKFFCTFVSSRWRKRGWACVCKCTVWLITPALYSISWTVQIPWLPSIKESLQFIAGFKAAILLSKQPHIFTVFSPHSAWGCIFPDKEHFQSKNENREGTSSYGRIDWGWRPADLFSSICKQLITWGLIGIIHMD